MNRTRHLRHPGVRNCGRARGTRPCRDPRSVTDHAALRAASGRARTWRVAWHAAALFEVPAPSHAAVRAVARASADRRRTACPVTLGNQFPVPIDAGSAELGADQGGSARRSVGHATMALSAESTDSVWPFATVDGCQVQANQTTNAVAAISMTLKKR
jgi:hypothetical protein